VAADDDRPDRQRHALASAGGGRRRARRLGGQPRLSGLPRLAPPRRRPDILTAAWWKEERGQRIFVDYNQNAPHKTVFGAWSVRARAGAQVSTPIRWEELDEVAPDDLTLASVPARLERDGDPWAAIDDAPQSLEPLLALHERDRANGLLDAPWPPVYPKQPDEPPRVAPSRARRQD
jgi:hypothetical protein